MPFQSEKQRRYLWANEPEIARDWTDTYGSGIARALGGRMNYIYGGITHPGGRRGFPGGSGRADYSPMGGSGPDRSHDRGGQQHQATAATQAPVRSRIQSERQQDFRQGQIREDIARREAEKDYRDITYMKGPGIGTLGGQQKINEYQPTFGQRFKMGIGNLFSGLGGGLRNLAGFVNPAAFAMDNPYARTAINYMGQKFAPNLYNKWSNQDEDSAISRDWERESKDFDWENINYNPNALTRLQMEQGIMSPDINKDEWDKGPDTMAHDYLSLSKFSDEQKKKAEKELGWGVEPKDIMPKLQQDDPTSWGFKTKDAIKAQEFIGWLETEKNMQLTDDQKREIFEAAGQEMEDPI